jgi:hypothetical protein
MENRTVWRRLARSPAPPAPPNVTQRCLLDRYRNGRRIFQTKGHGEFAFGCVQATMACDYATQTVFFTWDGCDEMDPVHGDGSAEITDDGFLEGEIAFHNGGESGFKAIR